MQKLADHLNVNKRTLERWINKYMKGGIESMLTKKTRKKGSRVITQNMHDALESKLSNSTNSFQSYIDAQKWIEKEFGVKVRYHTLRHYMIKRFGCYVSDNGKIQSNTLIEKTEN